MLGERLVALGQPSCHLRPGLRSLGPALLELGSALGSCGFFLGLPDLVAYRIEQGHLALVFRPKPGEPAGRVVTRAFEPHSQPAPPRTAPSTP